VSLRFGLSQPVTLQCPSRAAEAIGCGGKLEGSVSGDDDDGDEKLILCCIIFSIV
jgi:hypothetical protein